jgi:hypothetical protein
LPRLTLLTAAAPTEAPTIDAVGKFATFERPLLTMPFNVTGSPAMSVCCGYTDSGLPLSFQIAPARRGRSRSLPPLCSNGESVVNPTFGGITEQASDTTETQIRQNAVSFALEFSA